MVEIIETIDGRYLVLVNGFQWGHGEPDRSGAYYTTFPTREAAAKAYRDRRSARKATPRDPYDRG